MPRVMHVISGLQVGGAETALLRLVAASDGSAYAHAVVSLTPGGGMLERFAAAGIEVIELDVKRHPMRGFLRLVRLLRARRPAIVQTWMYHADLLGGLAARVAGVRKVIWGIRTTDPIADGGRTIPAALWLCARLSRVIPRVIVCVAEAARRWHADAGYDARRMVVVPNGVDVGRVRADASQRMALRALCGFGEGHAVVGLLSRFSPGKDPENFIRAAALIAQSRHDAMFLMVGRGMVPANAELASWIARTGCPDKFVLLGERADVAACLAAMDVFCLSSRTEGFPNVLAEAMAMRLPCVSTDVGDAAMLLGETGATVPKEDAAALAEAVLRLMALPESQRRSLGERAHERVRAEFGVERMRARFEAIYHKLLNEK